MNTNHIENVYDIVKSYINQQVDEHAKYELEQNSDMSVEVSRKLCLQEFTDNLLDDLECPVKIAEKFYGKVDNETIKKAFMNVDWLEYMVAAELLAVNEVNAYLHHKCRFCHTDIDKVNELSLLMIANIFNTLNLSKEDFLDYINCYIGFNTIRRQEVENIWDSALSFKLGTVCQHCFELYSNPFIDTRLNSDEEVGAEC